MSTLTPNKSRRSRGGAAATTTPSRAAFGGGSAFDLEVWAAPEEVPAPLLAKAREAYVAYDAGRDERISTMATAAREEAAIAAGEDDGAGGANGSGNGNGGRATRGSSRGGARGARGAAAAAAAARDSQQAKDAGDNCAASASAAEAYRQRWVALGDAAVARLWRYGSGARHALPPAAQSQLLAIVADRALHGDGGALAGRAAALLSACLAAHPPAAFVGASASAAGRGGGSGNGGQQQDQEMGDAAAAGDAGSDADADVIDAAHRGHAHVRVNPVIWTPLPQGRSGGGGGAGDDDEDGGGAGGGGGGGGRLTRGAEQQAREAAVASRGAGAGAAGGFPMLFRRVEDALAVTIAAKGGAAAVQALGLTAGELPSSFSASSSGSGCPDGGATALLLGHTVDVLQSDLAARLRAWSAANAEEDKGGGGTAAAAAAAAPAAAAAGVSAGNDQEMAPADEEQEGGRGAAGGRRGGRRGANKTAAATAAGASASSSAFTPRRAAAARLLTNSLLWRLLRDDLSWSADRAKGHLVRNLLLVLVLGSGELDGSLGGGRSSGGGGGGTPTPTTTAASVDVALLASHAARLLRLIFELLSAAESSGLYSNAWAELPLSLRAGSGAAAAAAAAAAVAAAEAGGADSAAAVAASAAAAAARAAADEGAAFMPTNHGNDRAALDRVLLDSCVSGVQQLLPFRSVPPARAVALRALPPLDRARLAAAAVAEAHQRARAPLDSLPPAEREKARLQAGRLALLDALHDYHSDRGRGAASYAGVPGGAAGFGAVVDAALWRVASDSVWATRGVGGADGVAILLSALLAAGECAGDAAVGEEAGGALAGGGGGGGGGDGGDLAARVKAALGPGAVPGSIEVAADLAAALRRAQAMAV